MKLLSTIVGDFEMPRDENVSCLTNNHELSVFEGV